MRKSLFILFGCLIISLTSSAQTILNPKIGPTFMNLSKPPSGTSFNGKTGYAIGFDMRKIPDFVYFNPGLHFVKAVSELSANNGIYKDEIELSYVRFKVKVGFNIINNEDSDFRFYAAAGTNLDILIKGESNFKSDWTDFFPFNSGIEFSSGVDWKFLSLDFGYNYGLIKIFKNDIDDFTGETISYDSKLRGLFVQVGGVIKVGK